MHLPWGGTVEQVQQLHDISIVSVPLERIAGSIEAKNEAIGNPRFVVDIITVWVVIRKCPPRHGLRGPTDGV